MLENLFIYAARDLRGRGWTQADGDNAALFYHPDFGTHEFFKACDIQCNAASYRRRLWWAARIRPAFYNLLTCAVLFALLCKLVTLNIPGIL